MYALEYNMQETHMTSFKSNLSSDLENAKNSSQNWTGPRPIRSEFLTYVLGDRALAPNEWFSLMEVL